MFGKAKGSAHEKDEQLPAAPQLQDTAPVSLAESDSTEISCIGPGMTVVGKISSEGTLNVFGRVEGELHGSIVRISDGAQVEGTIAAQELTIGGRFKGTLSSSLTPMVLNPPGSRRRRPSRFVQPIRPPDVVNGGYRGRASSAPQLQVVGTAMGKGKARLGDR